MLVVADGCNWGSRPKEAATRYEHEPHSHAVAGTIIEQCLARAYLNTSCVPVLFLLCNIVEK
jgi:hypothetical protein